MNTFNVTILSSWRSICLNCSSWRDANHSAGLRGSHRSHVKSGFKINLEYELEFSPWVDIRVLRSVRIYPIKKAYK